MTPPGATAPLPSTDRSPAWWRPALLAVLTAALAIRFLGWPGVFRDGEVYLFGTDSYAHIRRIWLCVLHYPIVPYFDPYVNFPTGAISIWPFGFDLLLATVARIASPGAPVLRTVEASSAIVIPFLGLISLYFTARAARALEGATAGILAVGILAVLPAHVVPTRLANVDHHVIELAVLSWIVARWLEASRDSGLAGRVAVETGFLFALSFAFWSGAQLYAILVPAGFIGGAALDAWRGRVDERLLGAQRRFLGVAFLAMIPVVLISPFGWTGKFTLTGVSWFHPFFVLLSLLVLATAQAFLVRAARLPAGRRGAALALLAGGGLALLTIAFLAPRLVPLLGELIDFVRARDPQARFTAEVAPATAFPAGFLLHEFSAGAILSIPALLFLAWRLDRVRATLGVWFLATLFLAVLQPVRLGGYLAIFLAILLGSAAAALWGQGGRRRALAAILVVAGLLPGAMSWRIRTSVETLDGNPWFLAIDEALQWIRENTPLTSGWEETRVRPEYSVLAQWSYGNWINHIARRPTVANPFALAPWHLQGFKDSIEFAIAPDEEVADRIARGRGARYVIATPMLYTYLALARSIDAPTDAYVVEKDGQVRYRPAFFRLVNNRLTLFDGSEESLGGDDRAAALAHYRLVFEGDAQTLGIYAAEGEHVSTPPQLSFAKVFERVEGARLRGRTTPLSPVEAEVEIVTNHGRHFPWSATAHADASGRFTIQVPYSTRRRRATQVGVAGPWILRSVGRMARVTIPEESVLRGGVIDVDWEARAP